MLKSSDDVVFIALADDLPVGYIHAESYNSLYSPPLKDVMSLAVRPDFQNLGIGRKLMEAVEKWAVESGRKGVQVLSQTKRIKAHEFYKILGYEPDKTQLNLKKYF